MPRSITAGSFESTGKTGGAAASDAGAAVDL
jgi:hypothetical protein